MRQASRWMTAGHARTLALAAAMVGGFVAVATVRGDDAKKVEGDLKTLQGTWVRDGGDGPELTFVFDGDTLKAKVDDMEYVCTVTLDSKASPAAIDLKVKEGPGDSAGKASKGIYKIEGKTLQLRLTTPGTDTRPGDFKTDDPDSHFFQLKKEAK